MKIPKDHYVECCKSLSLKCDAFNCIHARQHQKSVDYKKNGSKICTKWTWCDYVKSKVRCTSM